MWVGRWATMQSCSRKSSLASRANLFRTTLLYRNTLLSGKPFLLAVPALIFVRTNNTSSQNRPKLCAKLPPPPFCSNITELYAKTEPTDFDQKRPGNGQMWLKFGQKWPHIGQSWLTSAEIRQSWPGIGQNWIGTYQRWRLRSQVWLEPRQSWPTVGKNRLPLARKRPIHQICSESGYIWATRGGGTNMILERWLSNVVAQSFGTCLDGGIGARARAQRPECLSGGRGCGL